MPKVIHCRDAGVDCDFVWETRELRNALEHKDFHGMKEIPTNFRKMRS
jgi:predicted small metal-binding protein